jgi:two-component system, NtrC family, sensor kinase
MYDLGRMRLADMTNASSRLRKLGLGAGSMEEASQRVARWVFESFGDAEKAEGGCVLVRVYKTHLFGGLPPELQAFASDSAGSEALTPTTRCLVLLGTSGVEPSWCTRTASQGHKAIPLPSPDAVARLPMVAQLVSQLGIDVAQLFTPGPPLLIGSAEQTYNVFHVENALGSPHIPAQDFVERYGVRSVLGCGGQLPDGELYAAILFSRVPIGRETAEAFKPLTLALKLTLMPFKDGRVFHHGERSAISAS